MHSENLLDNTLAFTFLHNLSSVLSTQKFSERSCNNMRGFQIVGNDSDFICIPLKLTAPPCGFHASQKMQKNQ